jgi:hypothetical protein
LAVYNALKNAHGRHGDRVRLAAMRGFELGQCDLYVEYHTVTGIPPMHHNYDDPTFREHFDTYWTNEAPIPARTWR